MLAASPAVFVVIVFATLLQLGAIPAELPFRPTYVVELGGFFLNKVTPNGVGGMALSFRYLQKAGVDSGAATASVGLQQLVSIVANLVLVSAFFAATGRKAPVHFSLAGHEWVFIVIAGVVAGLGLLALTPPGRRFFRQKIWGFLRSAGTTLAEVAKSPRHVSLTLGGAVGWPLVEVVAFALCVHAVGGTLPFVEVAAVYMGGNLLAERGARRPAAWARWRLLSSPGCPVSGCRPGTPLLPCWSSGSSRSGSRSPSAGWP